jgi:hypothetical protein
MKRKDLIIIIFVVVVSAIFSYLLFSQFLTPDNKKQQQVEVVKAITSEFQIPDNKQFNSEAYNPTKLIEIGPNANEQPFTNQ